MNTVGETPFVGTSRKVLVDGLVDLFDQVAASEEPMWVSLEAPASWGKTRVVHEFYRRLTVRQSAPPYWPPSFFGDDDAYGEPSHRRKRAHPDVALIPAGSIPEFAWFGVSCERRAVGSSIAALRLDVDQLTVHLPSLEDRWRRSVSRSKRFAQWVRSERSIVEAMAGDGLSMLLPLPGLGLMRAAAASVGSAVKNRRATRERQEFDRKIDNSAPDENFAAELAEQLSRIAVPELPVVVFVEDLHRADSTLVETLARLLMASSAAVLVITSCWPGHLASNSDLADIAARVPESRFIRVGTNLTRDRRLPDGAALEDLDLSDRYEIVRSCMPTADESTARLIAQRFISPLAIQLFCGLGRFRRAAQTGVIHLERADVESVPPDVSGVLRAVWADLDPRIRVALALAALGSPLAINETWSSGEDRWHAGLIADAIARSGLLSELGEEAPLPADAESAYGWARAADEWLRYFIETDQRLIALEFAGTEFSDDDVVRFRTSLASRVLELSDELTEQQSLHRARTLLALHAEGFVNNDSAVATAVLHLLEDGTYQQTTERLRLAELGLSVASKVTLNPGDVLKLRNHHAEALGEAGQVQEAIDAFTTLIETGRRELSADHPDVLSARNDLAHWLGSAARIEDAIVLLRELLDTQTRVAGSEDPFTLSIRNNIGYWTGRAGRHSDAIEILESVLNDRVRILGADDPEALCGEASLATRESLANLLGHMGRIDEAILRLESLVDDHQRVLGPLHPYTLGSQASLAFWFGEVERFDDALALHRVILEVRLRVLGINHPDTLKSRHDISNTLGKSGNTTQAIDQMRELLTDFVRVLGPDAPNTLSLRGNIAFHVGESGDPDLAVKELRALLADYARLGRMDSPSVMSTRNNLAVYLSDSGRVAEAIDEYRSLLVDMETVLEYDDPDVLSTRNNLAHTLVKADDFDGAVDEFQKAVEGRTRVLGVDHELTFDTRHSLAYALFRSCRREDAVRELRQLHDAQARALGHDHAATLETRRHLEQLLGE